MSANAISPHFVIFDAYGGESANIRPSAMIHQPFKTVLNLKTFKNSIVSNLFVYDIKFSNKVNLYIREYIVPSSTRNT